mgnify:CR=1 FL=1
MNDRGRSLPLSCGGGFKATASCSVSLKQARLNLVKRKNPTSVGLAVALAVRAGLAASLIPARGSTAFPCGIGCKATASYSVSLKEAWLNLVKRKNPTSVGLAVALAVRAGFEPAVPFPVRQFSKLFLSASQAPHRFCECKRTIKILISETPKAKK